MDALERLYVRLARWEPLKDVYAKKADLAEDPDDKKRMLYVLAQVYDRELGDVAKAIETYQGILDLDADELPAIQSLDRLYGQAERWYDLLGNLERQVELAEIDRRDRRAQVPHRPPVADCASATSRAPSRATARRSRWIRRTPRRCTALDGLVHGKVEPVMAARVLEPIYETGGEYAKLVDVLEVMVAHNEDPLARVELLHRIAAAARADDRQRARGVRRVRARAARRLGQRAHARPPRAARRDHRHVGAARASSTQAEAGKSLDVPRQVDLLLAPRARVRAGARRRRRRRSRPTQAPRGRVRQQAGRPRARSPVHADRARGPSSPRSCAARSSSPRATREIARCSSASARRSRTSSATARAPSRSTARSSTAHPTHEPTLAALEQMFHAGHLQTEIGAVLEPLYEAASEFDKLHAIYEVQLDKLVGPDRQAMYQRLAELAEHKLYDQAKALDWWCEALVEDPRWERALEESERLAGETGAWDDMVAAYTRALERTQDKEVRRTTLLRLARVYEFELHDAGARGRDAPPGARDRAEGRRRARRARPALPQRRRCTTTSPRSCAAASRSCRIPTSSSSCTSAAARSSATRSATSTRRSSLLHGGARPGEPQPARPRGDREHPLPPRGLEAAVRDLREADRRRRRRRGDGRHLRAHGADLLRTRSNERGARRSSCWGRVLDIRGEEPQALAALADLTTRQSKWDELVEIVERQIAVAPDDASRFRSTSTSVASGKRSSAASATRSMRGSPPTASTATTSRRCARWRGSTARRRRGTSCRRRSAASSTSVSSSGAIDEHETIELYAQLGQLEGDVLGRVDEAVDAWRRVLAIDPSDFRALAALEKLFIARRPLGGVDRRPREARARPRRRGAAPRDAAPGRRDVGREGRGPRRAPRRSTSASARRDPANMTA